MLFTCNCNVFSYNMICYEIVINHVLFEGHDLSKYNMVLNEDRLELPLDLGPLVKEIITSNWNATPSNGPNFEFIEGRLIKKGFESLIVEEKSPIHTIAYRTGINLKIW